MENLFSENYSQKFCREPTRKNISQHKQETYVEDFFLFRKSFVCGSVRKQKDIQTTSLLA